MHGDLYSKWWPLGAAGSDPALTELGFTKCSETKSPTMSLAIRCLKQNKQQHPTDISMWCFSTCYCSWLDTPPRKMTHKCTNPNSKSHKLTTAGGAAPYYLPKNRENKASRETIGNWTWREPTNLLWWKKRIARHERRMKKHIEWQWLNGQNLAFA